ncbi:hypothetical protein Q4599_03460 [Cellulophaga lytica]|uniref:HipA family kinase n=1 Tax=Cellulophaga lytica TaxID=979 RepID=UPI0026E22A4B|nr:HipA family kinase [Cellulophaga lytica]MDO6852620.1 hypothetical protein [Cellulophaga lytica]
MLEEVQFRRAIKINSAKKTKGSAPLEVLCDNGEIYFVKTTVPTHPPFPELINELLCIYLCELWGLKVAIPSLVILPQNIVDSFLSEGNTLDQRYDGINFDDRIFFGTKIILNSTEFEKYNSSFKNKHDFNKFNDPLDLIKIGVFDFWIGNKDRRPSNPNIIISSSEHGFVFNPIDHTAAFGYQSNYKGLKASQMSIEDSGNILSTQISKSILKFALLNNSTKLHLDLINCINQSIENLEFIFTQIPTNWGLSKGGKSKILNILSNKERNKIILKSYHRFNI